MEGSFDVGGRELFLSCKGNGNQTLIYLHGYIQHASMVRHRRDRRGSDAPETATVGVSPT
jgi:hypothetical protein